MNREKLRYNSMLRRYFKYIRRRKSLEDANRNERRQKILTKHIERLHEKLVSMKMSLQRGAVVSAVAVGAFTMIANDTNAQSFGAMQTNPFNLTNVGGYGYSNPTLGDLDGDGDLDLLSSNYEYFYNSPSDYGYIANFVYYENTGTNTNPDFGAPQTNPFGLTSLNQYLNASPTFVDLDADGDLDVMVGDYYGDFQYYENTGNSTSPAFAAPQTNPFSLTGIGYYSSSKPAIADIDNDGDFDMMISDLYNSSDIYYFENTGTNTAPNFAAVQINPFSINPVSSPNSNPTLFDIDGDGDFDLVIGSSYNYPTEVYYYENTGTASAAVFGPEQVNPFGLTGSNGIFNAFTFADLNNDGLIDALAGDSDGDHYYWPGCQSTSSTITTTEACSYLSPAGNLLTSSGTYMETIPNSSGCDSIITINLTIEPIADLTFTNNAITICGSSDATLELSSSQNDVNYYLRNDLNDTIVDGPIVGDGNAVSFNTSSISTTTTYNVYAEKSVPSGALEFHGSTNSDERVDCGNDASVQLSGTQITLEAWINPQNWVGINQGHVINKEFNGGSGNDLGYLIRVGSGGDINFVLGDGNWNQLITTGSPLVLDQWQHVAATYDGAVMQIYLNGTLVASQNTTINFSSPNNNLTIGAWAGGNGSVFDGMIDEVRVWNVARTSTQIQEAMDSCLTGTENGLVTYYQFEDGAGSSTAADLTANGNNGTLTNMDVNADWVLGTPICSTCKIEMTQTATVTVNPALDNSVTNDGTTITANLTSATYQWLDCDNNYSVIAGETSQSYTPSANGSYAVEIMATGCTDTSACETIVGLSLAENGFGDAFVIYPNPSKDIINIDLGENSSSMKVRLVSLEGKELYMDNINEQLVRLDLSSLPSGVYILNISDGENQSFHKIVKQ